MKNRTTPYFDDETINIYDIWLALKKRKWLICIIILISFICFFAYSILAPNVYKVSNVLVMSLDKDVLAISSDKDSIDIINMLEVKPAISLLEKLPKEEQVDILGLGGFDKKAFKDIKISEIKGDRGQIKLICRKSPTKQKGCC